MRYRTILLLAALSVSSAHAGTVTISNDTGGEIAAYHYRINQIHARGDKVKVTGKCYSACTLHLRRLGMICAGPRAEFWFHKAYFADGSASQAATEFMYRNYPSEIKSWIRGQGGLKKQWIVLKGPALRRIVPSC